MNDDGGGAPASVPAPSEPVVPELLIGTPSLKELEDAYFEKIYRMTAGEVGGKQGIAAILGISRPLRTPGSRGFA